MSWVWPRCSPQLPPQLSIPPSSCQGSPQAQQQLSPARQTQQTRFAKSEILEDDNFTASTQLLSVLLRKAFLLSHWSLICYSLSTCFAVMSTKNMKKKTILFCTHLGLLLNILDKVARPANNILYSSRLLSVHIWSCSREYEMQQECCI